MSLWTPEEAKQLEEVSSFAALTPIAIDIISRMGQPVAQVCGPVSTGGLGDIGKNIEQLDRAIDYLIGHGVSVFRQTTFEDPMQRIKSQLPNNGYWQAIMDEFYFPIFETGLIKHTYFLPDWQSSNGATQEYNQSPRFNIQRIEMPDDWDARTDYIAFQ